MFFLISLIITFDICNALHVIGRPTIKPKNESEYDLERSMFYHELDFDEKGVVPDWLPKTPEKRCRMIWEKCEARNGNIVDQSLITEAPRIVWNGEHDALYTMVLFHTHLYLKMHQDWLPWVVGNIPGPNLYRLGELLWPYKCHYLKDNAFIHKHIVSIYKQKEFLHFDLEDRYKPAKSAHANFNLTQFVAKYDLGSPKFGNFIFSNNYEWDNPEKRFFNGYFENRDSHAIPTIFGYNLERIFMGLKNYSRIWRRDNQHFDISTDWIASKSPIDGKIVPKEKFIKWQHFTSYSLKFLSLITFNYETIKTLAIVDMEQPNTQNQETFDEMYLKSLNSVLSKS